MAARLHSHGSPGWAACWTDEALNLDLKRLCSTAHAFHWQARILVNWGELGLAKRRKVGDS
eukprot:5671340-Lingulodinium_polyedra.AAC.1